LILLAATIEWALPNRLLNEAARHFLLLAEFALAVVPTGLFYFLHRRWPIGLRVVAERFHKFAGRVGLCVVTTMLLPVAVRLPLLLLIPPPEPSVHDEFGHLLIADTLAAGRLANPPHPLWRHFETPYVLQQPTYSSIYPIGQGAILAVGKIITGTPWAGVLLSVSLMAGAITWMFFGCLPPAWAAAGGLLAAIDFGMFHYWIDSYWGGAFCAFGGALLFGALCRLRKKPSASMGFLVGLGWSIAWLIRPFESLLLFFFVWLFLAVMIYREPPRWQKWLAPILMVLFLQISAGLVTGFHNRAVTGSFKTLPYVLSRSVYGVPQSFLWQRSVDEPVLQADQLRDVYRWQLSVKLDAQARPLHHFADILSKVTTYFITPWYVVPVLIVPVLLFKDRDALLGCCILASGIALSGFYPFFFPHYIAAYACVIFFLIVRGLMALYHWSFRDKPVGQFLAVFLMFGGATLCLRIVPPTVLQGTSEPLQLRTQVQKRLEKMGGRHVVFVRYGTHHNFDHEWVYNSADIDASPVVWCRIMGPNDDREVVKYYKDRQIWVVDADSDSIQLASFQP
jgi:hypothetical protein